MYQNGYQHGQALQLLSVIMLHDLRVTVCVCLEGSALFHISLSTASSSVAVHVISMCLASKDATSLTVIVPATSDVFVVGLKSTLHKNLALCFELFKLGWCLLH